MVFLTALFYVLSSSGHAYKPVAMLGNLAPGHMNRLVGRESLVQWRVMKLRTRYSSCLVYILQRLSTISR